MTWPLSALSIEVGGRDVPSGQRTRNVPAVGLTAVTSTRTARTPEAGTPARPRTVIAVVLPGPRAPLTPPIPLRVSRSWPLGASGT
jgi:hypothetical protein